MSEYKTKNIKIVPVGLNYFNRNEFRSEVIIEFGKPFEVPSELAEKFRQNKREATEILLEEIHSRMKAVTLTAPSYTELRSLLLVRKLYLPPDIRLSPKAYSSMCKKFSKGYDKLKSREETKALMTRIHKYINELEITGISDHEVRRINLSLSWMFKKLIISFILFHIFLIFAIPGILIVLPFILYVGKKAEKERIMAKSKNPNKIEALDVVASVKIQYAFLFAPLVIFLWCLFFIYHMEKHINKKFMDLDFSYLSMILFAIASFPVYIYCK
jgi:glycerol-3-phosphate O-acyltransferase / dihydroxyacetone phosphate acyltransferase